MFFGSLRLNNIILNELLQDCGQKIQFLKMMKVYLQSVPFMQNSKNKFENLFSFYKDQNQLSFENNNLKFAPIDFLRLFNLSTEKELLNFFKINLSDDVFETMVLSLKELCLVKSQFNSFMFKIFDSLSENVKEKISVTLKEENWDMLNVKEDTAFLKSLFKKNCSNEIVKKHLSIEYLNDVTNLQFYSDKIILSLFVIEEEVITKLIHRWTLLCCSYF